jgi:hypothetical protein
MAISPLRTKMARAVFHGGLHRQHFDGSVLQSSGDTYGICRHAFPVISQFAFLAFLVYRAAFSLFFIFFWADKCLSVFINDTHIRSRKSHLEGQAGLVRVVLDILDGEDYIDDGRRNKGRAWALDSSFGKGLLPHLYIRSDETTSMGTPAMRTLLSSLVSTLYHVHVIFFIQTRLSPNLLGFSGEKCFSHNLTSASKGNGLDLDRHTLGKLLDGNARASRLVGEVLFVDRVHLGEMVHGGDEDVNLSMHV